MTDIQQKLFTLLCEVDDICRENDVTYYLAAGCALGAVRHGGFLPWDDDIDVYITRDNWEKFKNVIYDNLKPNRNFVCEEKTDLYDNPIGRYVDKDTMQMMHSQVICGECCGIVLEFFIMDPMPVEEEKKKEHRKYMRVFTELLTPYFQLSRHIYKPNEDFDYDLYMEYEKKAEKEGYAPVLEELKSKFACYPEEGADEYCMRWGQRTITVKGKHFGEPLYITFEGRSFPTLNYPREYFRNSGYGDDWMCVPTAVNQISHDISKDLYRPYQDYVDMYMPLLDRDKIYKAFRSRKRKKMQSLIEREKLWYSYAKFKAYAASEIIKDNAYDAHELKKELDKNNFKAVSEALDLYYERQFDKDIMSNMLYVDIGDQLLCVALENLILQGFYYKAAKILNCRKNSSDAPLSPEMEKVEEHIDLCRKLSVATMDDVPDPDTVKKLLGEYRDYEDTLDYQKARLWLIRYSEDSKDDPKALLDAADEACAKLWDDGELLWYRAWALHALGDEAAKETYQNAVNNTRNGFVWKEAKELYGIEPFSVYEDEEDMEESEEDEENDNNED